MISETNIRIAITIPKGKVRDLRVYAAKSNLSLSRYLLVAGLIYGKNLEKGEKDIKALEKFASLYGDIPCK